MLRIIAKQKWTKFRFDETEKGKIPFLIILQNKKQSEFCYDSLRNKKVYEKKYSYKKRWRFFSRLKKNTSMYSVYLANFVKFHNFRVIFLVSYGENNCFAKHGFQRNKQFILRNEEFVSSISQDFRERKSCWKCYFSARRS